MLRKIFYDVYGAESKYPEHELKVGWIVFFIMSGLLVTIISISLLLVYLPMYFSCNQLADINQSLEFDWTFWNGCLVRTEGMDIWIPAENIRTLVQ